ncbi:MAG: Eco57I restriction-modification methylase domain-containing protein, partial [Bacteroidota bacterium]
MFGLDPDAWLKHWSSAFDVKKVTDKFYEEYDRVFREMKKILAPKFNVSARLYDRKYEEWTERERKREEPLHLFVQNLVNRLMFLKFLEKRRWLDFNPNYLADLNKRAVSEKKNFYQEYLFYVFFAGLNRQVFKLDAAGQKEEQFARERIGVLPFLNGGLFEKEPIDEEIEIPNDAFAGLFDLFSRYNFTVNEDTPLDVEVAVNPEMLGKVFEESVIARKEKGAYYTPRNIVSFMCREALKNHLSQCKIQNAKEKIERLVDDHSAEEIEAHDAIEIYKALHNIKVLDPAVGSGAFPVNMMLELILVYK